MIHAVKALIYNMEGKIFLQQRDYNPDIIFPGHWTFFGGLVEKEEDFKTALRRELKEELEYEPLLIEDEIFSWEWKSKVVHTNHCFPILCGVDTNCFQLREGLSMKWFKLSELNQSLKIVPGILMNLNLMKDYLDKTLTKNFNQ